MTFLHILLFFKNWPLCANLIMFLSDREINKKKKRYKEDKKDKKKAGYLLKFYLKI